MTQDDLAQYISLAKDQRDPMLSPSATVAVVIYNSGQAILDLMASLKKQTFPDFEIVVVNNGKIGQAIIETVLRDPVMYIESNCNSVSLGRNIATVHARGDIIIFLDDDCLAHEELVDAHVKTYRNNSVAGVQGKGLANKRPFYCHFSRYDLGPKVLPSVAGFEGNMSFRKSILIELDGFDPQFFGAEGLKLSWQIVQKTQDKGSIVYNPEAIIYHDFAKGFRDYIEKSYRHTKMRDRLVKQLPDILEFARSYGPYLRPQPEYSSLLERILVKIVGCLGLTAELIARKQCYNWSRYGDRQGTCTKRAQRPR